MTVSMLRHQGAQRSCHLTAHRMAGFTADNWSGEFIDRISQTTRDPIFLVRGLQSLAPDSLSYGDIMTAVNMTSSGAYAGLPIQQNGIRVQGAQVSPRSWSSSVGGFEVDVLPGEPWQRKENMFADPSLNLVQKLPRGIWAELKMGFPGWSEDRFQTIPIPRPGRFVSINAFIKEISSVLGPMRPVPAPCLSTTPHLSASPCLALA